MTKKQGLSIDDLNNVEDDWNKANDNFNKAGFITNTQTDGDWKIKPYCNICGNNKNLRDLRTTHNTKQHTIYFDILGDQ